MSAIEKLLASGVPEEKLWDVAEYLLLGEEAAAGKQNKTWERRWQLLSKRGTRYVSIIYQLKLENSLKLEDILNYLLSRM